MRRFLLRVGDAYDLLSDQAAAERLGSREPARSCDGYSVSYDFNGSEGIGQAAPRGLAAAASESSEEEAAALPGGPL